MIANWWYSDHGLLTAMVVAATVVAAASMVYRFFAFQGRLAPSEGVDAYHAAFLAGGPQLAVYAAIGELRRGDAVGTTSDGVLTALTAPPMDATALPRAVREAAVSGSLTAVQLRDHRTVDAALTAIRSDLQDGGLLLTSAQRSRNRWFVYAQLVVLAFVAVRVAVDLCLGAPIDELWRGIVLICLYLAFMVMVPTRTRTGTAVLAELRRHHDELRPPRMVIEFGILGAFLAHRRRRNPTPLPPLDSPGAAALAIGLFGFESLYALDPSFASDIGTPRQRPSYNV